jgi:SecD/SecF fusion protein
LCLSGFSFALLIGIIIGTYSSVFIATPIVVDLYKENN